MNNNNITWEAFAAQAMGITKLKTRTKVFNPVRPNILKKCLAEHPRAS